MKVDNRKIERRWDNKQLLLGVLCVLYFITGSCMKWRIEKLLEIQREWNFEELRSKQKLLLIGLTKDKISDPTLCTSLTFVINFSFFRYALCLYYLHFHDFSVSWLPNSSSLFDTVKKRDEKKSLSPLEMTELKCCSHLFLLFLLFMSPRFLSILIVKGRFRCREGLRLWGPFRDFSSFNFIHF